MINSDKNFIYLITGQHIGTGTLCTINNKTDDHLYTSYTHHCYPDKERDNKSCFTITGTEKIFNESVLQ